MYVYTYIQYSHTNIHTYILSELGLAQSEDSFQLSSTTKLKTKKDRDLPCRLFIGNGVSISLQERMFRKARENSDVGCLQQGTSGRFTTRTEDLVLCNRKPSYSVLWSVLGVARS